jgi:hypothetical protein
VVLIESEPLGVLYLARFPGANVSALENAMAKKGPWFCFYRKVWSGSRRLLRGRFRFERLKSGDGTPIIVSRRLPPLHAIQ